MNKITIKKIPFKLNGDLITTGQTLSFKAIDRNNKERDIKELKGLVILSTFPDINTSVCDTQTREIAMLAEKHKDIKFLSITTDGVDKINKWCAANGIDNVDIWSDKYYEFGKETNTLIPKIKKLARGFFILKDNKIIDMSFKKELSDMPDFELIKKYI